MADILLVQPPIRDFYLTAKRTIPYGLACIAGALQKNGFSVEILDGLAVSKSRIIDWPEEMSFLSPYYGKEDLSPFGLFHHYKHYGYSFEHLGKLAKASGAFLVGISSLFSAYSAEAMETAKEIKRFYPGCKIVIGGHHPTAQPEHVLSWDAVDYVIRGEGEDSMPLLAKALYNNLNDDEFGTIPGICYRKSDGTLFIGSPSIMKDIENAELPASDLIHNSFYRRKGMGAMVVTASRGCPMACSYCSFGSGSIIPYRKRHVSSIIKEITYNIDHHQVRFIDFEDENLSMDKSWFLALLHEIQSDFKGLDIELRAMNGLYPSALDEDIIAAMKTAGFKTLNLSVGSTISDQLAKFKRHNVTLDFEQALIWAEKYSMDAVGYMIASAPNQNPHDSLADLLYLADKRVLAGLSIFYPSPGSLDYEACRQRHLLPSTFSLMRSSAFPLSHTTSRIEAVTLLRLARILNFLKSLADEHISLPSPEKFDPEQLSEKRTDRKLTGIKLIQWFLADGKIRGITKQGTVYEHHVSESLSKNFIVKIQSDKIRGCRT